MRVRCIDAAPGDLDQKSDLVIDKEYEVLSAYHSSTLNMTMYHLIGLSDWWRSNRFVIVKEGERCPQCGETH
jgi:hypothetical protein